MPRRQCGKRSSTIINPASRSAALNSQNLWREGLVPAASLLPRAARGMEGVQPPGTRGGGAILGENGRRAVAGAMPAVSAETRRVHAHRLLYRDRLGEFDLMSTLSPKK